MSSEDRRLVNRALPPVSYGAILSINIERSALPYLYSHLFVTTAPVSSWLLVIAPFCVTVYFVAIIRSQPDTLSTLK